ncbi:MAG: NAD(P)-binding domain-containing protein, partial [Actinomycetota bacterium]|nr:NAD(P)-binding domain-containing protein [Actinomycetota bacterium]
MNVGVLGGTGPAGKGLSARLASVGVEVVLGSRSQERADQACSSIRERWPDRTLPVVGGDNAAAAEADVVVLATPW